MPPRSTPERIVILVLVLTATMAACDKRTVAAALTQDKPAVQSKTQRSWNVVPALGVRG